MNSADYPAAHSMDTDWFAVDADGHVALMRSDEPGPLPVGLEHERQGWETLKALALLNPSALLGQHCQDLTGISDAIMLLPASADIEAIRAASPHELEVGPATAAGNESVIAICLPWGADALWDQLHRDQLCLGCASLFDEEEVAPRLGLYFYDAGNQYQSGPYERGVVPPHPLHLAELPPSVRQSLAEVVFPEVRFSDTIALQPLEHLPCSTWSTGEGVQYLGSDLKTLRPIPPRDDKSKA